MTTFTVPATVEPDESPVYVAVAGSPRPCVRHALAGHVDDCMCPPSASSALVALLDPCETCGGDPSAEDHRCAKSMVVPGLDIRRPGQHCDCSFENDLCHWCGIEWLADGEYRCPDCDNHGFKLVTLQRECDLCWGVADSCTQCGNDGVVSLPGLYRLTELLPVVTGDLRFGGQSGVQVDPLDTTGHILWSHGQWSRITAHGTPEPDGCVAMFEKTP